MKYLNGTMLIYNIEKGEIASSVIMQKPLEVNIIGRLIDGHDFINFVKYELVDLEKDRIAAIYIDNFKTNLVLQVNDYLLGDGETIIDLDTLYDLNHKHKVEIEWCEGV